MFKINCGWQIIIFGGLLILAIIFLLLAYFARKKCLCEKRNAINNANTVGKVKKYFLFLFLIGWLSASFAGLIGLNWLYTYVINKDKRISIVSDFDVSDGLAAILAVVSIVVGLMIYYIQEYNADINEITNEKEQEKINTYYKKSFELDILQTQNKIRTDLVNICSNLIIGVERQYENNESIINLQFNTADIINSFNFDGDVIVSLVDSDSTKATCCLKRVSNRVNTKQLEVNVKDKENYKVIANQLQKYETENKSFTLCIALFSVNNSNIIVPWIATVTDDAIVDYNTMPCCFKLEQKLRLHYESTFGHNIRYAVENSKTSIVLEKSIKQENQENV